MVVLSGVKGGTMLAVLQHSSFEMVATLSGSRNATAAVSGNKFLQKCLAQLVVEGAVEFMLCLRRRSWAIAPETSFFALVLN